MISAEYDITTPLASDARPPTTGLQFTKVRPPPPSRGDVCRDVHFANVEDRGYACMVKKIGCRLRERACTASGRPNAESRNLGT